MQSLLGISVLKQLMIGFFVPLLLSGMANSFSPDDSWPLTLDTRATSDGPCVWLVISILLDPIRRSHRRIPQEYYRGLCSVLSN